MENIIKVLEVVSVTLVVVIIIIVFIFKKRGKKIEISGNIEKENEKELKNLCDDSDNLIES